MTLAEQFRKDIEDARESLGLGHGPNYAPVEEPPTDKFERQVHNTTLVALLCDWVERLATEVDELRAATPRDRDGEGPAV